MALQIVAEPSVAVLEGDGDYFGGITVKPNHYGNTSPDEFHHRLSASLEVWRGEGKRGVWVKIPLAQSELIPVAAKLGFQFHHAHPDHVMMTQWLPTDEPNNIPRFGSHQIGVAGFVVNDRNEVLLIQEKWIHNMKLVHWKLPGGLADPGENLANTAVRETFEETGIRTEFVGVLSFRHMHRARWGTSDLYFACYLRPLSSDIVISPDEIAAAKWMDLDEYMADPQTMATNQMIAQAYKDAMKRGLFIQPFSYPHFIPHRADLVMYRSHPVCQVGGAAESQCLDGAAGRSDEPKRTRANM